MKNMRWPRQFFSTWIVAARADRDLILPRLRPSCWPGTRLAAFVNAMADEDITYEVGTKLLFENDRVRVWEMKLAPGQASARHRHQADYLFVYLTKSKLTLFGEGEPQTSEQGPGFVEFREVGHGVVHKVENAGNTAHWEILVELKGPSAALEPRQPETND